MRPHNPKMFRTMVAIVVPIKGQDEDGGPTEDIPVPTSFLIPCYIVTTDTVAAVGGNGDSETGRTPARLFFPTRPNIKINYRIFRQEDGRIFRAKAAPEPRDENLWVVNGEAID